MKMAIMQPYLFPYIGYFQLIYAVDVYVLTGDLQYMKDGWVNRNRIFTDGRGTEVSYFTFPVEHDDFKKPINQRYYMNYDRFCEKLMKRIKNVYGCAKNYSEGSDVIRMALNNSDNNVASVNIHTIRVILDYLEIDTKIFVTDEILNAEVRNTFILKERAERAYYLCQYYKADNFVNAIGGRGLYFKDLFAEQGIRLNFIKTNEYSYNQRRDSFVKDLSIIDIIMNNERNETKQLLKEYNMI